MTNAFYEKFEQLAHGALLRAGLADMGALNPDTVNLPCRVYIDRNVQRMGEQGEVVGRLTTLRIVKAGLPDLSAGDLIAISTETFRLVDVEADDEAAARWIVESADE